MLKEQKRLPILPTTGPSSVVGHNRPAEIPFSRRTTAWIQTVATNIAASAEIPFTIPEGHNRVAIGVYYGDAVGPNDCELSIFPLAPMQMVANPTRAYPVPIVSGTLAMAVGGRPSKMARYEVPDGCVAFNASVAFTGGAPVADFGRVDVFSWSDTGDLA